MAIKFSHVLIIALLCPAPVFAQDDLQARAEVNVRPGTDRSITMMEFWIPMTQSEHAVIYGDLRMMGDSEDNKEGNIGIGYRQIANAPILGKGVAGAALWFDRRTTQHDSHFNQLTLGSEWLGEEWDFRANGYLPLSNEEYHNTANPDANAAAFTGTGIILNTDQTILEEPQAGIDAEFGREIGAISPWVAEHTDAFRVYGGGYYFDAPNTDSTAGWKTRVAIDVNSDIQLGARFQKDGERGSQGFIEATLRFPFGKKKSYRKEGLKARLDEAPERDIDIVTGSQVIESGDSVALINKVTGAAQEILHVDNTAGGGGDGSVENPFNTLAAAQAAANAQTIIYLHEGDGTTTGQSTGLTLNKTGQQLIGSGSDFVYDSDLYMTGNGLRPSSILLASASAYPLITNTNPAGNGITVTANNVVISGVTVDSATQTGIFGNFAVAGNFNFTLESVNSINNTVRGTDIRTFGGGSLNLKISNSTFTGNIQQGAYLFYQGTGSGTAIIENNTFSNNGNDGFRSSSRDTYDQTTILQGNVAQNNAQTGFNLRSEGTGTDIFTVTDNYSSNNTIYGFLLRQASGAMSVSFSRNISTANTSYGVYLDDDEAGQNMIVDFGGGVLGAEGYNSIFANTAQEIRVDLDGDELKAENNWWGNINGLQAGERTLDAASTIDANPALTAAP